MCPIVQSAIIRLTRYEFTKEAWKMSLSSFRTGGNLLFLLEWDIQSMVTAALNSYPQACSAFKAEKWYREQCRKKIHSFRVGLAFSVAG